MSLAARNAMKPKVRGHKQLCAPVVTPVPDPLPEYIQLIMSPPERELPNREANKNARNICISILLWGPPEHADIFCSKIEKVMKKVGPRNRLHRLESFKVAGPPFGHSGNKPNGICVWGRSICHSAHLGQNLDTQASKQTQVF